MSHPPLLNGIRRTGSNSCRRVPVSFASYDLDTTVEKPPAERPLAVLRRVGEAPHACVALPFQRDRSCPSRSHDATYSSPDCRCNCLSHVGGRRLPPHVRRGYDSAGRHVFDCGHNGIGSPFFA